MDLSKLNPKGRFSNRVENYAKYRPNYPNEIIKFLNTNANFTKESIVADIGSGTGISSKLFLDYGNQVYGIEPNADMRRAGEKFLNNYTNFTSIDASSENTKLESESVNIIVCGQSFHWFEPEPTKKEFFRILKPDGSVVVINNRRKLGSEFMNEYVELIRKYTDSDVSKTFNPNFSDFFESKTIYKEVFDNPKIFNLEILKGDLLSYSYIPSEEKTIFSNMISEFELLFTKHNKNGSVIFDYETVLYLYKMK
jgi:ubiquinone/menaquinone biosynthesis C-methylase UbiE